MYIWKIASLSSSILVLYASLSFAAQLNNLSLSSQKVFVAQLNNHLPQSNQEVFAAQIKKHLLHSNQKVFAAQINNHMQHSNKEVFAAQIKNPMLFRIWISTLRLQHQNNMVRFDQNNFKLAQSAFKSL